MRSFYAVLALFVLQLCFLEAACQESRQYSIPLKKGTVMPTAGLDEQLITQINRSILKGPAVTILQFRDIPTEKEKATLSLNGIQLLNYIGGNAYVVSIHQPLKTVTLTNASVRSILSITPSDKLNFALQNVRTDTTVVASIFPFITNNDAIARLNEKGFISKKGYGDEGVLEVQVPAGRLNELAQFEFIEYIEPPMPLPVELNNKSTQGTRANLLHTPDYNLNGEGIVFEINELPGYPQAHIDFMGRSINGLTQTSGNYHPTHVHGTIAGAGVVNELYKGYAPKSRFISSGPFTSSIPANVVAYGVDLTNNSYGSGGICPGNVTNINSAGASTIDRMAVNFKSLINVFAAGNSGSEQCPVFPLGYNTIYSGWQANKSILTVGASWSDGTLASFSSKGPVYGRLKPEIVAPGVNIVSTTPNNYYGIDNGTSMSCPAVVGGLGLLYQRYMQIYGSKPENALMKPLLCNSATDLGPPGPDYGYGFGFMNLNRAVQDLDAGNFYKDSVSNQSTKTKTITVSQGITQLKLMLYWTDPPASPLSTKPIVNDLDIKLTTPDGTTVLPFVLDTVPSLVMNAAKQGTDHINNIEQVVINNPVPGNYTVKVEGYEVGEGATQAYYVVYDLVPNTVQLTFPTTGEVLAPGDNISVQWDSWGNKNSTYTLEFSPDNGQNWQTISSSVNAGTTSFDWIVPSIVTNAARLRLTRNSDGKASLSGTFRILGVPTLQLSSSQCPGSIAIQWSPVTGATEYEVMWYRNGDMTSVATTTATNYTFRNLSEDSVYWFTVRAISTGLPGRRAFALSRKPDNGNCRDAIYNNDLKADALVYPLVGRQFTSTQIGTEHIRMRIKNLDDSTATGFSLAYSVNDKPWVTEITDTSITANSSLEYVFKTAFDFSQAGTYTVRLVVNSPADQNKMNDTVVAVVRHLANAPVDLMAGTIEDLEKAITEDYTAPYIGLKGLDRFDYDKPYTYPMLRVGSHYVQNSTKCFEFTYSSPNGDYDKGQSLIATYNLSLFDTSNTSAALDFSYVHIVGGSPSNDSLLIRGSEKDPWIYIQNLYPPGTTTLLAKEFKSIPITDYLKSNGQNTSSSFQVRWSTSLSFNPLLLDNIKVYNTSNDVALNSIDSLLPYSCGLSSNTPLKITVQNNSKILVSNLTVKYRVNNGTIVSENISSVSASSVMAYQFNKTADLSSAATYTIEAWIEHAKDSYTGNDTARIVIRNQTLVKAFPHIEDFETNNGGWYTGGTNSSWEYGTPTSTLINAAASGNNAWKTNLDGNHNTPEQSWLYTGCYDFSQLSKPVISMSLAMNTDTCESAGFCDNMMLQFCANGKDWNFMSVRSVYKWQQFIASRLYNRWHVVSQRPVDTTATIQFRFQFRGDNYNTFEGIGVDDFHVYDSTTSIYEGNSVDLVQPVNAAQSWTEFRKDNKLLAALQPQTQNLGKVQLQTYLYNGAVRNFHGQYYLNRNFVFKPEKPLNDSVLLRLYFTDRESDSLLFAKNCNNCTLPKNAYLFGISYYKSSDNTELDSSILNNRKGEWDFIPNNKLKMVPFMTGYYIEFKVKDAGEFRLSNGGLDGKSDLPVTVQKFSAERVLSNVDLSWNTSQEINIHHFEIEVAKGNDAFQSEQFEKIGEVASKGRSAVPQAYSFSDNTADKKGVRYYRIKNVDAFGNYTYSKAIPVVFGNELEWQVFPNPSNGKYNLLYQSAAGEEIQLSVFNSIGQKLKEMKFIANGFVQKQEIDLSKNAFANGVYTLHIRTGTKTYALRLVKQ